MFYFKEMLPIMGKCVKMLIKYICLRFCLFAHFFVRDDYMS